MDHIDRRVLRFDRFTLDLARGCLRAGDQEIDLRPKTFELLCYLAENAGRLLAKQELFEAAWPNVSVCDDSLVQCIRELRQKLGDDDRRLIKTVSRRGYLLDATVSTQAPQSASETVVQALLPVLSSALERPAIAVLPFAVSGTNTSAAGALADEIAAALCRLRWIHVTTVDNARYRLRGRLVSDIKEGLRVTALLTDASTQRIIWADHWTGDRNDLVAFEERVAAGIARAIQPVLRDAEMDQASRRQPGELRAWGLTMRALASVCQYEPAALGMALELLERAMELAPHDALPMSVAAWCHGLRAGHHFTPQPNGEKERARALAARAARLNTGDPLAETTLAAGYAVAHDLTAAELHAERALTLDPTSAWAWGRHAWVKAYRGQANEAIECFQIARTLAPFDRLHFLCCHGIAASMFDAGRYEESIAWYRRGIAENPAARWIGRWLVAAYVLAGRKDEGRHTLAELRKADPELTIADVRSGLPWHSDFLDRASDGLETAGMHR